MPIVFVLATANTANSFDQGIPRIRQLLSPYGMYGPAGVSTFFAKLLWIPMVSWGHIRLESSVRGHILCSWKLNASVAYFKCKVAHSTFKYPFLVAVHKQPCFVCINFVFINQCCLESWGDPIRHSCLLWMRSEPLDLQMDANASGVSRWVTEEGSVTLPIGKDLSAAPSSPEDKPAFPLSFCLCV